ncbi:MAG: hypothetical protein Q4A17_08380 [Thermoguttaceae bacterium]|nr:hypothetical protein [Thermoguttaceae bacterium]
MGWLLLLIGIVFLVGLCSDSDSEQVTYSDKRCWNCGKWVSADSDGDYVCSCGRWWR